MFLKRSLVLMVGVLLFIGGFLLKFRNTDAGIEDTFRQARVNYGVEGTVLTSPEVEPSTLSVPGPTATITPAAAVSAPAPAPSDSSTTSSSTSSTPDNSAVPAGSVAPDSNVIIGPVAPAGVTPDSTPSPSAPMAPEPAPSPAPDTNSGPMPPPSAPAPSTMNYPRGSHLPFLALAAYQLGQTSPVTNPAPVPAAANPAPATNALEGPATAPAPTNAAASYSNPVTTNGAPVRPLPVEASVIVLGFHQFTGPGVASKNIYSMSQDVFASEMKYLHDNGYHVVPLSDVVRFIKHEIGLPPNSVAISIDDGYKSAINFAAPVLKQYNYPWTFFVYPQFITRTEGKGAASWPDLVELQKEGVDVECHSMTHPILTSHTQKFKGPRHALTPEEYDEFLTDETFTAKAILEKELNKKIVYFAYPYGAYNKAVQAKVLAAGFEAIFTVADNPVHTTTSLDSIGRYVITKPVERLFASYLRQGALSVAEADPAPGATTSNPRPVITAVLGYTGNLDAKSLETDVRDYGAVPHDFDPKTSTVRLHLPRDLIQSEVLVNIRIRDAQSGQMMVANWHFNYEPAGGAPAPVHQPIGEGPVPAGETAPVTNATPAAPAAAPLGKASAPKASGTAP